MRQQVHKERLHRYLHQYLLQLRAHSCALLVGVTGWGMLSIRDDLALEAVELFNEDCVESVQVLGQLTNSLWHLVLVQMALLCYMDLFLMLLVSCVCIWLGLHFNDLLLRCCGSMTSNFTLDLTNCILSSRLVVRFIGLFHLLVVFLHCKVSLKSELADILSDLGLRAIYRN